MIIIDETKLRNCDIELIGNAYGMYYDYDNWSKETYDAFLDMIVWKLSPQCIIIKTEMENYENEMSYTEVNNNGKEN